MKVSYFSRATRHPLVQSGKLKLFSIAAKTPKWWRHSTASELAPNSELLDRFKLNIINVESYQASYVANLILLGLNPETILKKYKDCVLCCYEKIGRPCHRQFIQEWIFSYTGEMITELGHKTLNVKPRQIIQQIDMFE